MESADIARTDFYLERADEGGEALELGCGGGVVSVALVLAGLSVWSFEPSEALAAQALDRRRALGPAAERWRVERADLRGLRVPRRFRLVFAPADALLALGGVDDLAAVFATARAHLAPVGRFAFDLSLRASAGPASPAHAELDVRAAQSRRPNLRERAGALRRLELFQPTFEDVELALDDAGLRAYELWADFSHSPWEAGGGRLVVVAG